MGGSVVTFMSDRRMNYLAHGPVLRLPRATIPHVC